MAQIKLQSEGLNLADTFAFSGTVTGAGAALTGSTNNTIPTVTGADAISGEANLTFDGSVLTAIGDNGTTSLSPSATYDNIVIDDNGSSGITYLGSTTANQQIRFDDSGGNRGVISYNHDGDALTFGVAAADHFRIASNGDLTATDTSIGAISDIRVKENISDFTYDLATFKQLQPKTFDWKNPSIHNGTDFNRGFISQELETIDDYWVGEYELESSHSDYNLIPEDEEGKHKALTSKLGKKDAMYVSVINQLIAKIETLEAKVTALENA
jgi:hypothetical protein